MLRREKPPFCFYLYCILSVLFNPEHSFFGIHIGYTRPVGRSGSSPGWAWVFHSDHLVLL
jgi:hypothetical protein